MKLALLVVIVTVFLHFPVSLSQEEETTRISSYTNKKIAQKFHNKHRKLHQVSNLITNKKLVKYAEGWCQKLAENNEFKHSHDSDYAAENDGNSLGENLYYEWQGTWATFDKMKKKAEKKHMKSSVTRAVNMWVDEKQYYDYHSPNLQTFSDWGHFTQVRMVSTLVF